jgi:hypothetical protein
MRPSPLLLPVFLFALSVVVSLANDDLKVLTDAPGETLERFTSFRKVVPRYLSGFPLSIGTTHVSPSEANDRLVIAQRGLGKPNAKALRDLAFMDLHANHPYASWFKKGDIDGEAAVRSISEIGHHEFS